MGRQGPVTGDYTGNRRYLGNISFAQGAAGAALSFIKKDTQVWYVDSGKTGPAASGDGLTWEEAFLTLQEAVTAAGDFDTILIAPNAIETVAATGIDITQEGLRIIGSASTEAAQCAAFKITAGTASMFRILANRVEICNIYLSQRTAYPCIEIGSATVGAVYETHIHNIAFDGYGTATYAVRGYGGTVDTVCLVVEDCYLQSFATAGLESNGTRDTYRRNTIQVPVDTTGIHVTKTGGDRAPGFIADNIMCGIANSSTTGIEFDGNTTLGKMIVARNLFTGSFDTVVSNNTGDVGVENYQGTTTGGSLLDFNSSA